ncbi:terminase family protein [Ensifer sesbaniae]|uniref:terminase large subunit domain-containing protein n=1 Tax=Ensifer sesbaniae TaxID=1214071 RepID=UPI00200145E7|nr:terminase family protein [Ensifer sesbaniae]
MSENNELEEYKALIAVYREDIEFFTKQVFGYDLSPKQKEFCEAFRTSRRISFKGGTGFGKTFVMAACFWWALICHDEVQVSILGPSEPNLKSGAWKEILKFFDKMHPTFKEAFDISATRISQKGMSASCFGEYRLVSKDNVSSIRGIHMRNNFVFVDESTGVDDEVFVEGLGGVFADPNPKLCIISNPSRASGYFWRSWCDPDLSSIWTHVHGTFWDSPNYDPKTFEETAKSYGGPTSRDYRVMIEGEFPLSDEDGLIPKDLIDAAIRNKEAVAPENSPIIWGLDPAGQGKDSSALCIRQDNVVKPFLSWQGLNPTQLSYLVRDLYQKTPKNERPAVISVDANGLGYGVYSNLKDFGLPVHQCMFAASPTRNPERYTRIRDQLYWELREWLATENVHIPNDSKLIEELATPRYEDVPKIKIEKKDQIKKRIGRSPDFSDALALTFAPSTVRYSGKHNWSQPLKYDWLETYG